MKFVNKFWFKLKYMKFFKRGRKDEIANDFFTLIKGIPNDMTLGEKVRERYRKHCKENEKGYNNR
jgi:hypothetical protein